jgi:hypothetical protein
VSFIERCPRCQALELVVSGVVRFSGVPLAWDGFDVNEGTGWKEEIEKIMCARCGWSSFEPEDWFVK